MSAGRGEQDFGTPDRFLDEHVVAHQLGRLRMLTNRVASCRLVRRDFDQDVKCMACDPQCHRRRFAANMNGNAYSGPGRLIRSLS